LDIARLRESFGRVGMRGDELPLCSDPFIKRPEVRDLLPISAAARRGDVAGALVGSRAEHDHIRIEDSGWSKP
jgi:hypothetical protein